MVNKYNKVIIKKWSQIIGVDLYYLKRDMYGIGQEINKF